MEKASVPTIALAEPKVGAADSNGRRPTASLWRFKWVLVALFIFVLFGAAAHWVSNKHAAVRYATVKVTRGTVARVVTATGTVNPVLTIIVGSYVSGIIQDQFCDFNTRVRKGQLCAKIDPRPYQSVLNQARADLANAKAQVTKDLASLVNAKIVYARDATLLERGIVSQEAVDNAKSNLDQALAQIEVDKAVIQQREAALESAQVNLGYTNIISPVDGTVVSRNITIGQTVAASFQTPILFLIATDLTRMQVDTNVSESDIAGLREGARASFTVEAYPAESYDAKVVQFRQAPQTVQNVVTYDIVVGVGNKDFHLKPGMTATTHIVLEERDDVLRVPDQALRYLPLGLGVESGKAAAPPAISNPGKQAGVWVLRGGRPVHVPIQTGLDDDTNTQVLDGDLRAGDEVIVGEQRTDSGVKAEAQPRLLSS
jgi:HlyD family secretion protein